MVFGCSTAAFRLRPLSEAIEMIARTGFGGIELLADRPHGLPGDLSAARVGEMFDLLGRHSLKIANLNGCAVSIPNESNPSWIEEDWRQRERRVGYTLDCIRLAAAIGVPTVTTEAGGVIPASMNKTEARGLFIANLNGVLPLAMRLGVKLLVQLAPGMAVETSGEALELLEELNFNEWLGIDFHPGHFSLAGEDPRMAWDVLRPWVGHVRIEAIGDGDDRDVLGFLAHVRASDYRGFICIHPSLSDRGAEEALISCMRCLSESGFIPKPPSGQPEEH